MFQYSLCRIVYCCPLRWRCPLPFNLSSFNIRSVESCTAALAGGVHCLSTCRVSIFALSNRVLLPLVHPVQEAMKMWFQYSLCRIVYCCPPNHAGPVVDDSVSIFALSNRVLLPFGFSDGTGNPGKFQYSLCRIVYCCLAPSVPDSVILNQVSIFALSNRVLLP